MRKLFICNTDVGKRGSVGERLGYVLKHSEIRAHVVARSVNIPNTNLTFDTFPLAGMFVSLLNQVRLKLAPNLNTKKIDLAVFDIMVIRKLRKVDWADYDTVYLTEISPRIVKYVRNKSHCKIILDLPIAPLKYRQGIDNEFIQELSAATYKDWIKNETYVFREVDRVVVPSAFVKEEVLKYRVDESKVSIVSFGTDTLKYRGNAISLRKDELIVIFCGVLNARKGIQYLLKAWENEIFRNHKLVLCGRRTKYFDSLMKQYNFRNVEVLGHVDVYPLLENSDIYVLPSLMEGSSKSIYEAMAMGLPIICTNECGSIVRNERNGFLIPKQSDRAITSALVKLIQDVELRAKMSRKNLIDIATYTWESYAHNISKVL